MLRIAGKTVGPIGLKFFVDTHGWPGGFRGVIIFFSNLFKSIFSILFFTCKAGLFS